MKEKLVLGNWKMNLSGEAGVRIIEEFLELWPGNEAVQVGFAPTALAFGAVHAALKDTGVWIGGQDCLWPENGAFTGSISAEMWAQAGAKFCLVGHSERRGRFGKLDIPESTVGLFAETDESVNLKSKALLEHGLTVVMCVGETLSERDAGFTDEKIALQIRGGLDGIGVHSADQIAIAYEPVWAIGTGKVCDASEAGRVCAFIRKEVEAVLGAGAAESVRVLYGGSVKALNAAEIFAQPAIDGGLIGGASLVAAEFAAIVSAAGAA